MIVQAPLEPETIILWGDSVLFAQILMQYYMVDTLSHRVTVPRR